GIDHCALGAWFGQHSHLPDALIQTMHFHHTPDLTQSSDRLVTLVATADHMANHLQRQEPVEAYNPETNPGLTALVTRWPAARKERLFESLPDLMNEAVQVATCELVAP